MTLSSQPIATAFLIGASSTLSRALAQQLADQKVKLVLFTDNKQDLEEFCLSLNTEFQVNDLDIFDPVHIQAQLKTAWHEHDGAHLVIINTGVNGYHESLPWELESSIIDVNVKAFAACANCVFNLMREQGYGQIAAINSIAGQRGGPAVAYHASKAFAEKYLQGLSMHAQRLKLPITISDIQLGMFDKAALMKQSMLLVPIDTIAKQILDALKQGKRRVYVSKRWRIVAWLNRLLPEYIYNTRHWKTKKK